MKRPSLLTVKALLAQVFIINGLIAYPYLRGETRPECTRGPLCLSTKVDCKAVFLPKISIFGERKNTSKPVSFASCQNIFLQMFY